MLTNNEIDTLIDALTAWESKNVAGDIMSALFTTMLTKDSPEARAKMEEEEIKNKAKSEQESRERKEQSLLLKAKLIQLKQANAVNTAQEILST